MSPCDLGYESWYESWPQKLESLGGETIINYAALPACDGQTDTHTFSIAKSRSSVLYRKNTSTSYAMYEVNYD